MDGSFAAIGIYIDKLPGATMSSKVEAMQKMGFDAAQDNPALLYGTLILYGVLSLAPGARLGRQYRSSSIRKLTLSNISAPEWLWAPRYGN